MLQKNSHLKCFPRHNSCGGKTLSHSSSTKLHFGLPEGLVQQWSVVIHASVCYRDVADSTDLTFCIYTLSIVDLAVF